MIRAEILRKFKFSGRLSGSRVLNRRYLSDNLKTPLSTSSSIPPQFGSTGKDSESARVAGVYNNFLESSADSNERLFREITKFSHLPEQFGANQHILIDDELRERLRSTLWMFKAPIRYAFAYGSGVFSQGQSYTKKPQIDMIFGVTYSQHWHSLNLSQYPDHYSGMRHLGSRAISVLQDRVGAGVYFNTFVEINGLVIKYGVVNIDTLCYDLLSWDSLYLSGRLHKPVKILRDDPRVRLANQRNLFSVIRTALLLLPETFTDVQLYETIASISYMGDPRMKMGAENPHKVRNIVQNQKEHFYRLYAPLIDNLPNIHIASGYDGISDKITLRQDMSPIPRGNMVIRLPPSFRQKLYARYTSLLSIEPNLQTPESSSDLSRLVGSEFEQLVAADENLPKEVARAIYHTVYWPSMTQSAKGLLTAGFSKSIKYLGEKISKNKAAKK
ncbi:mitochondrial matrix Mmp37-domain-containing protein [Lipomyces oligophaga]|uniref:mitochondrial matrix Mmp37-domain-containing protein n=1 Tax=Lipomyces oligophaga TaxID=45792 RepID=UPI0034CD89BD